MCCKAAHKQAIISKPVFVHSVVTKKLLACSQPHHVLPPCCCQAGPDRGEPGDLGSDLVGALAQQLEEAQAALAVVAPQAAAAEVHVKQQQRHAQQLAGELQEARAAQKAAEERGEVLQV